MPEIEKLLSEELKVAQASFQEAAAQLAAADVKSADSNDVLNARHARKQAYNRLIHATKRLDDFTSASVVPGDLMTHLEE